MEKIRIKCPVCGAVLEAVDNPSNYGKNVTCPNCKSRNKFSSFKQLTSHPAPVSEISETEIKPVSHDTTGALMDPETGRIYPLEEGRNLIGRMTRNVPSKASIPISTDNRRMSRAHLYIDVVEGTDGHYHAYASNASNQNETTINGTVLEKEDKIGLKHQDRLSLSGTELIYLGSRINDETVIHQP